MTGLAAFGMVAALLAAVLRKHSDKCAEIPA